MNLDLSTAVETDGFQAALHIVIALRLRGFQAYFAGGCVRDLLLGIAPKDYDVATSAFPEQVLMGFDRTFSVGMHFGVVIVCTANKSEGCEVQTEVATFRADGQYSDGRRPDEVSYSDTAEQDVTLQTAYCAPLASQSVASPKTSCVCCARFALPRDSASPSNRGRCRPCSSRPQPSAKSATNVSVTN